MDKPILIFVEGDGDEIFIGKYLTFLGLPPVEIVPTGGFTKIAEETVQNRFLANSDSGGINLLIFDADSDKNNGGFGVRKQHLESQKSVLKIDFEMFLFPNNQDDGDFENLLEKIINPHNQFILDCFDSYSNCLQRSNQQKIELRLPPTKSKIYAYWEIMPMSRSQWEKFKNKKERFYDNPDFFDLNHSYIDPLKVFLSSYFN